MTYFTMSTGFVHWSTTLRLVLPRSQPVTPPSPLLPIMMRWASLFSASSRADGDLRVLTDHKQPWGHITIQSTENRSDILECNLMQTHIQSAIWHQTSKTLRLL